MDIEKISIVKVLRLLGKTDTSPVYDKKGKPTNYFGTVKSSYKSLIGVLYFPWNRPLGMDKILRSYKQSLGMNFDGTIIISNKFSGPAIDQTQRINASAKHFIALIETEEIQKYNELSANINENALASN